MSHAACIGADLYSLLVRHPWRPRGFVVGNGAEGYVNVASVDGEIVRYASASLVGLRALAVNQKLMTWGSEETTVGVGVGGSVGVVRVGGETGVLHAATSIEDSQYMCSALQWNPDVGSQLAATFQPQSSGVRPLHKCVKVYDLSGGTSLSPHAEFSSGCAYALCWLSHSTLLASTAEGLLVCDTRQREQQAGSADTTPLYHLSRNPADPHTVAGIRVGPHGYAIELHDTRHLEKGAVACAPSAHSIGTLAWHSTSGCLVTTVVGGSVVETWDASQLAREIDTARDVGYESDYDCSRATAGADKEGPLGDRIGSGSGSGVSGGPRPVKRACSGLRGHEEKRVGQAVLGSAWAGSAEGDRRLVLLTADGCDVVELSESEQRVSIGVAACGVVVQGATGAAPAVLHAPDYSDVATAMRMREERGLGTSRYNTLRVAEACDDVPLQQWAWWTWLMRRAEEHTRTKGSGKSVACPSVLSMVRMEGELDTRLLTATDQERKQRQHDKEAGGAGLTRVAGGREGAEKVACKGHHAVLERQFKVYDSEWRRFLQQLCGWSEAADMPEDVVPVMQGGRSGEDADDDAGFEQSVANQILHLRLTAAEDVLRHAGGRNKPTYSLMAFALSSLTTDSSVAWRETVGSLQDAGLHPHLTAALRFLSCWSEADADEEGGRYSTVLDCPSIDVLYRIGFAARYLSDTALVQYVTKVSQTRLHPLTKLLLDGYGCGGVLARRAHTHTHTHHTHTACPRRPWPLSWTTQETCKSRRSQL